MCVTYRSQNLKMRRIRESATVSPDETAIEEQRNQFPRTVQLSVEGVRVLEDVVDGLGIRDPQTFLLCEKYSQRFTDTRSQVDTHPKRAIPTSHGSMVFQDALFNSTGLLALPVPLMSFRIAISKTNKGERRSSSLPQAHEGFGGPGISLIEGRLYLLYKA
jgi:hypothetical protein